KSKAPEAHVSINGHSHFLLGGIMKSNRTSTMKWIMMVGLLASSLLFWQAAHAASDLACSHLDQLIRFHFDCCGSNSSSGVCEGLLQAAVVANCGDRCNPCVAIGENPAPSGCTCAMDPNDPDLPRFGGFQPIACISPSFNVVECCVGDPNVGSLCQSV